MPVVKTARVTCINRYGSLLPGSFFRNPDPFTAYTGTVISEDPSWSLVQQADFVLFDRQRGLRLLGPSPRIRRSIVPLLNVIHEAPVFVVCTMPELLPPILGLYE